MQSPVRSSLRLTWIAGIVVVIVGSLLPEDSLPIQELARLDLSDKIEHFVAYAVLGFLPAIHERRKTVFLVALAVVALGVGLEFLQEPVGRDFETGDMLADVAGIGVGLGCGWALRAGLSFGFRSGPD